MQRVRQLIQNGKRLNRCDANRLVRGLRPRAGSGSRNSPAVADTVRMDVTFVAQWLVASGSSSRDCNWSVELIFFISISYHRLMVFRSRPRISLLLKAK